MFSNLLENKKILVVVTGSIAIYKSLELIREFIKSNAQVKVLMSEASKRFITPLTFEAISQNEVLHDKSESWANDNNHVAIAKWADIIVIAPATINAINKLSNGIADELYLQAIIASNRPKILAPAANTIMYQNQITQNSLKMLKLFDYTVVEPIEKLLACNDKGIGALAEIKDIFFATAKTLLKDEYWVNRRVVVSGGGSIERVDDVRFISNFSSSKMAHYLSLALYLKGADVCLVSTKILDFLPSSIHTILVESSNEMLEYLQDALNIAKKGLLSKATLMDNSTVTLVQKKPYLFMSSAISDYVPKYPQSGKIKKSDIGKSWNLELKKNIDILSSLNKDEIFSVGFKAEMDEENGLLNAKNMLKSKNLDAVCFNDVSKNSFGSDENEIVLILKDKEIKLEKNSKLNISFEILKNLKIERD